MIKLVNKDGKIVGKDPETGETVPIELGETVHESVDTEESRTEPRTITASVPTDYDTVRDAIDDIKGIRRSPGLQINVLIESGYEIQNGIVLDGTDLRHVSITSEEDIVTVADDYPDEEFINATNGAVAPHLDIFVDGSQAGPIPNPFIRVDMGSTATASATAGVDGGFLKGVGAGYGSIFVADGDRPDGFTARNLAEGIHASQFAVVVVPYGDLTDNVGGDAAIRAGGGSVVYASFANLSGSERGVRATNGAFVSLVKATVTDTGRAIGAATGSTVIAKSANLDGAGGTAISLGWAHLDIADTSVRNARGSAIIARGASVSAERATFDGCENGIIAIKMADVSLKDATVTTEGSEDVNIRSARVELVGAETSSGSGNADVSDTNIDSFNTLSSKGYILYR